MPKKSFALRIDEKTMKAVEKWAADEFRSVNGQLEWMITKMLRDANRFKKEREAKSTEIASKKDGMKQQNQDGSTKPKEST